MIGLIAIFVIVFVLWTGMYVYAELQHLRKGHDVYEWTRKLDAWLERK